MDIRRHFRIPAVVFLALLPAALVTPAPLPAQDPASAVLTPERLAVYAKAFTAIGEVRDRIQALLAETRNKTAEAQKQLREQMHREIAEVLANHGMTSEEYQRITFLISTDAAHRERFDALVAPARPANAPGREAQDRETSPVLTHMGHIKDAFRDTPNGEGLLTVALAEAGVAAQHAALAARDPSSLDAMKLHAGHVLHAIDPAEIATGPGRGYGVGKAAAGIATHVELAASSEGASQNAKTHAAHVAASARNTVERADRIAALTKRIQAAATAADAAPLVEQLQAMVDQLTAGLDADGDGTISWQEGEGGLQHVEQHVNLLIRGEG